MTTAREIMTEGVQHLNTEDRVIDAARQLADGDVGALPVCNAEGRLEGMVTDRDLVVKVLAQGLDPTSTTVGELADQDEVVTIGADDSLEEAMRTMADHAVRRLPVIDGTELVGMVSQADLARACPEDQVGELVEAISTAP
ncbi:MAG TPA: CBS domain-containing protein [Acidimicrobiales bacterium]|jgi:CBS domain-containing protein|nr:CBS domain-containing protein [Acidimicrobiales bacterium]